VYADAVETGKMIAARAATNNRTLALLKNFFMIPPFIMNNQTMRLPVCPDYKKQRI
jgi:hypothetical protein